MINTDEFYDAILLIHELAGVYHIDIKTLVELLKDLFDQIG